MAIWKPTVKSVTQMRNQTQYFGLEKFSSLNCLLISPFNFSRLHAGERLPSMFGSDVLICKRKALRSFAF